MGFSECICTKSIKPQQEKMRKRNGNVACECDREIDAVLSHYQNGGTSRNTRFEVAHNSIHRTQTRVLPGCAAAAAIQIEYRIHAHIRTAYTYPHNSSFETYKNGRRSGSRQR